MPIRESHVQGAPSAVDLSAADMDGAKAFYGALLGWGFRTIPDGRGVLRHRPL
jgi:predicted enzyme related to lactoylglutathione lyase